MSDETHSPGPWQWSEGRNGLLDANGRPLLRCSGADAEHDVDCDNPADARLIAAAPDTKRERDELLKLAEAVDRFGVQAFAPYLHHDRACRVCDVVTPESAPPYAHAPDCLIVLARALLDRIDGKAPHG